MNTSKFITTKDIIALTVMSFISFFIESTIGLILVPIISVPLVGGFLSSLFDAIIIFTAIYAVPRIGAPTFFGIVLLALSTITPSFGPPGLYKITIGIGLGVFLDLFLLLTTRKKIGYIIGVALAFGLSIPLTYAAWLYVGNIPTDELEPYLYTFMGIYTILGALGALAGSWIFEKRLMKYKVIQELRK